MELILIDGNSLINRAFYATPILTAPDGTPTNAVLSFVNMLFKIEEEHNPKYIIVAFDRKEPTFRHKMYSEYKAGRHATPEELLVQIPLLKRVLDAMGVCHYEKAGFEADDIIGSLAKKYNYSTAIYTGDKDSFQLVDDTTSVYFTKRGTTDIDVYNKENFKEKTEIEPMQIIDLKALMGDSSDNIKGVAGVGEKTAKNLITTYGSVESVYEHIEEIKGKLQEKLIDGKDSAMLSKTLATINTNMDIKLCESDFSFKTLGEEAVKIFRELRFTKLLSKLDIQLPEETPKKQVEVVDIKTKQEFLEVLNKNKKISLVFNRDVYFSDGVKEYKTVIPQNFLDEGLSDYEICEVLKDYLENENNSIILLDNKQDKKRSELKGVDIKAEILDVSLIKYLVDFTGKIADINSLVEEYGLDKNAPACALFDIYTDLFAKLKEQNLENLYFELELPLSQVLYEMEQEGFKVDLEYLKKLSQTYSEKLEVLKREISLYLGDINLNSPNQLSEALFIKLGLKGGKKLKRGGYSVSADVLEKIKDQHPVINLILEYRKIQKLTSTYIDGMLVFVKGENNLVKTTFNQALTSTGRLSSSEPNLQNIPIRSEEGKEIRKMFVSRFDNGYIVSSDYSQIELRLLADFSKCERLIKAFSNGEDIHAVTASRVFGVPLCDVTSEQRRSAKAVNFGIVYGISAYGLSEQIGVSPKEAGEYIDAYFGLYPEIKYYMDSNVEFTRKTGYATTMLGRKRYIKEINSSDHNLRSFGERVAMNMPLQGSAADVIKEAMIKVYKELKRLNLKSKLILQIHDELVIDAPEEEREIVEKILKEQMESVTVGKVKLEVETYSGKTWYEVK